MAKEDGSQTQDPSDLAHMAECSNVLINFGIPFLKKCMKIEKKTKRYLKLKKVNAKKTKNAYFHLS